MTLLTVLRCNNFINYHFLQLEEHGSDVNVVALKKHGTKVHMSGGDFNVIRDPWRHHSLFAGLFHPHEMPGHGHFPMEQFHQHFTYIANDRAINHHVYEHHTHNEDNHIHEHDPGHEHDYFYHHPPEPNNHGGKREFEGSAPINVTAKAQVKQEISNPLRNTEDVITIPLRFSTANKKPFVSRSGLGTSGSPSIVPQEVSNSESVFAVKSQIVPSAAPEPGNVESSFSPRVLPDAEFGEPRSMAENEVVKKKKELPKGKSPRLSPFNGNRIGPKYFGKTIEMPFAPIFKRQLSEAFTSHRSPSGLHLANPSPNSVHWNENSRNLIPDSIRRIRGKRSLRLKKAFLSKLLSVKGAK